MLLLLTFYAFCAAVQVGVLGTLYTSFFGLYLAHTKGFAEAPAAQVLPPASGGINTFQVTHCSYHVADVLHFAGW
jgi:hypothetical protein